MKTALVTISVVATGYLAFIANDEFRRPSKEIAPSTAAPALVADLPSESPGATTELESTPQESAPVQPEPPAAPIAAAPETPKLLTAPPGFYFLTERVSVETDAGIIAMVPGEKVKLIYRNKDGTARVQAGAHHATVALAKLATQFDAADIQSLTPPANYLLVRRSEPSSAAVRR